MTARTRTWRVAALGWILGAIAVLVCSVSATAAGEVPSHQGLLHGYDASAHVYDGAAPSVQVHTSEAAAVVSHNVPESTTGNLEEAAGPLSVVFLKSVAANTAEASGSGVLARLRGLDWADDTGAMRIPGSGSRLTSSQATQMADRVGYRPTNFISRGERVFTNGKTFITQDTTAHTGGLWKMANSVQDLRAGARLGTYDYDLNWIAP